MMTKPSQPRRTPKRGRPALSGREFAKRRTEISSVALKLFQQEGYAAVSMRRLGREVGLTPMALYRYFPSKLEILSTLWTHILKMAFGDVAAATKGLEPSCHRLEAACYAYVDHWFENVDQYQLVFMNADVSKTDVTSFASQPEVIALYEVFFIEVAACSGTERDDPEVKIRTDALICHLHGIMHSLITMQGYPWAESRELVRRAVAGSIDGAKRYYS